MSSFNKVVLVGHLGGDPIIREFENQIKVADITLATHEVYSRNGETRETTDWHDIVAWRKLAEFCEKSLNKGKKILVEGKLRTNTWEEKETGKKRKSTYILAETIRFMERKDRNPEFGNNSLESESLDGEELTSFDPESEINELYPEIKNLFQDENSSKMSSLSEKKTDKKKGKPENFSKLDELEGSQNSEFPNAGTSSDEVPF